MGCGCLFALVGLAAPRFALFVMWLITDRLTVAFDNFFQGFLGFLLLPFTTLFYALAYAVPEGVRGFGWILVGFGLIMDLSAYFGGENARRQKSRG